MNETPSVIINSVDRAMDILLYIYNTGNEVSITNISQALGIYKSTVYRTLVTLENKGFVEQNPDNGRYALGMRLYTMGLSIGDKLGLQKLVKPYTHQLHEEFREAVNVSIIEKNPMERSGEPNPPLQLGDGLPQRLPLRRGGEVSDRFWGGH